MPLTARVRVRGAAAARDLRRRLATSGHGGADALDTALLAPAGLHGMREGERFVLHVLEVPAYQRKLEVVLLLATFEQVIASDGV